MTKIAAGARQANRPPCIILRQSEEGAGLEETMAKKRKERVGCHQCAADFLRSPTGKLDRTGSSVNNSADPETK